MKPDHRSLTLMIVGWCAALLPEDRTSWAAAMKAEVDAIEDRDAAFVFAAGCVWGSVKERTLTMKFAAQMVHFTTVAAMLALALAAAIITERVADAHAPSAFVFGTTSILFAAAVLWSLLRGSLALIRTASTMIPVYMMAYIFVQSQRAISNEWVNAELYRALAIEGIVIWAALLAGGIFILRAGTPSLNRRA